jgi:hypothetical protein
MGLQLTPGGTLLDESETSLWAHALTRTDDWVICGPDAASMRFGFDRRKRDHLISLGGPARRHRPPAREAAAPELREGLARRADPQAGHGTTLSLPTAKPPNRRHEP